MHNEKKERKKFISIGHASLLTGLDQQTIRKFFDNKIINGYKTPSGQRKIDYSSIQKLCYPGVSNENPVQIKKTNFLYARVSTKKQMDDLSRQIEFLKQSTANNGNDYVVIQDIGSGINFKRKGLSTILDTCLQRVVGEIVVAHKDRLCRFAFELIESIVIKAGGVITILDKDEHTSPENELSEDLLSIIHIFNCRQMGKRSYKCKKIVSENSENTDISNKSSTSET